MGVLMGGEILFSFARCPLYFRGNLSLYKQDRAPRLLSALWRIYVLQQ
jgi:hypothetical protein